MPLTDVFSKNNGKKNYFNRFDIESTPKQKLNETLNDFPDVVSDQFFKAQYKALKKDL